MILLQALCSAFAPFSLALVPLAFATPLAPIAVSAAPASPAADPAAEVSEVEELTHRYLHHTFGQRDVDAMMACMSDDVAFVDPTAELWGGPAARGVQGKDVLRKLVASWGIVESDFTVRHSFVTGPYAVYVGEAMWHTAGQAPVKDLPFCTILKVRDGAIVHRRDYGDYDRLFPQAAKREAELVERADRYFRAYREDDPRTMEGLLHDDAVYLDPTRAAVAEPLEVRGKYDILAMVEQAAGNAGDLQVDVRWSFASNRHVVYECLARYTMDGAEVGAPGSTFRLEHPVLHVLEFRDGLVVEHRRYLDYATAGRQIEKQRG